MTAPAQRNLACEPRVSTALGPLPLLIEPGQSRSVEALHEWMVGNAAALRERLVEHGAFLFRGFDIAGPDDFEHLARGIDDELKNEYLGTSPRDGLTDYVFSASELPGFYPIPQHCEMSFTAQPPRRVFFCCLEEPAAGSGETPLVDFRAVYRDLDAAVRQRFEDRGVRIVRNYSGPGGSGRFDLWKLKRWDEMFLTTDHAAVEAKCREEGFEPQWIDGERLRLVSTQAAVRLHPDSGEKVWHNHTQVFHLSAAPGEYKRIFALRPSPKNLALWLFARAMVAFKRLTTASDDQAMHCTYQDGGEIPDADMEHLRDAIWKNLVITPWRRGDVIAIDNHSVAHGRLPYSGPRKVAVCWA